VVEITNPWPNAKNNYTYVLQKTAGSVPDSLKKHPIITVPIKSIIVTSTTHIPSLEMLGVENTLRGFPGLSYISSEKVRARIDAKKVREVGSVQNLNTEVVIDIAPDVIVGFGIDNNNKTLDNLQKSGLKVMINGDWHEQTPLGKAEWIKFFGALYDLDAKASKIFDDIESDYKNSLELVDDIVTKPTVMAGAIYQGQWYLPTGNSWGALLIKQAGGDYLWSGTAGSGSLSLPFESVLEKAHAAHIWIGPAQFTSLREMAADNPHYKEFLSYQNRKVYSFSTKKGKTGGVIYYELAPNRPDLVLKDMIKILHPEVLPEHKLYFFEQLK
jgi:iron complex transport system substrate-binding protein